MSNFCAFASFFMNFLSSDKFFANFRINSRVVGIHTVCGISVGASNVVGIPAVKGIPSAVDVCDTPLVSAAVHHTVAVAGFHTV
jgi:hypothetical protein